MRPAFVSTVQVLVPSRPLTVVYRRGGTANFSWHRTTPVYSQVAAEQRKAELERAGYPAEIYPSDAVPSYVSR